MARQCERCGNNRNGPLIDNAGRGVCPSCAGEILAALHSVHDNLRQLHARVVEERDRLRDEMGPLRSEVTKRRRYHDGFAETIRRATRQAREEEREAIKRVISGGSFLTPDSPVAEWARGLLSAIDRDAEKRDRSLPLEPEGETTPREWSTDVAVYLLQPNSLIDEAMAAARPLAPGERVEWTAGWDANGSEVDDA